MRNLKTKLKTGPPCVHVSTVIAFVGRLIVLFLAYNFVLLIFNYTFLMRSFAGDDFFIRSNKQIKIKLVRSKDMLIPSYP